VNLIRWLLWKLSQRIWDLAYRFHNSTILYYSCLGLIKFSPNFNEDKIK